MVFKKNQNFSNFKNKVRNKLRCQVWSVRRQHLVIWQLLQLVFSKHCPKPFIISIKMKRFF